MQHPDEGMIHAWLDGELPEDQANEIAAHARDCPECSAKIAEARGLIAASTRILTALDDVPTGVIPEAASTIPLSTPGRRRRWFDRTDIRAAAAVLVVAGASYMVMKRDSGTTTNSLMVADRVESAPMAASENAPVVPATPKETAAIAPPVVAQRTAQPSARRAEAPPTVSEVEKPQTKTAVAAEVSQSPAMLRMDAAAAPPPAGAALSEVVVTGVAKATTTATASARVTASPSPRVISVDSTTSTRRTIYEISPGVRVTLVDSPTETGKDEALLGRLQGRVTGVPQRQSNAADARESNAAANTISWTELGHRYELRGSLPVEKLQALRRQLTEQKR